MYNNNTYKEAVELRIKGYSLNEICKIIGISKSSASLWLADIKVSEEGVRRLKALSKGKGNLNNLKKGRAVRIKNALLEREKNFNIGYNSKITSLDLLAIGLYWGEG